jgi:hypothetical protein
MIDFHKDIKITPEDMETQNRLRRERRPLSMDEYLEFLKFSRELFGHQRDRILSPAPSYPKRFEL